MEVPVPDVARPRLRELFARRRLVDQEIANFLAGVLAGQGIDPARLSGCDEARLVILVDDHAAE